MFCWTAPSWMRFCASGLRPAMSAESPAAGFAVAQREVRERRSRSRVARLVALGGVAEANDDVLAFARDAGVLHLLLAQQRADVGQIAIGGLVERRLHVDLQQEMHAAAQVEAEVHRQRADRRQPSRRARHLIQRDDVVIAELLLQHVLGLEPRIGVGEADLDAGRIDRLAAVGDVRRLERVLDGLQRRIDLRGWSSCWSRPAPRALRGRSSAACRARRPPARRRSRRISRAG